MNERLRNIRAALKTLTDSELSKLGRDLGLNSEILDIRDLVIDIGAEYISDSPDLEKYIPVK